MKTYIAVFTLFAVTCKRRSARRYAFTEEDSGVLFAETNVPPDLRNANPTDSLDNPKLKCFNACMMKKKGTNGKIDPETQLVAMHPDFYDTIKEVVHYDWRITLFDLNG
ncbi:hypothetical protein TSAR_000160 [Trichomalopsis sarcophagae]|uniref:Uncharacterized protein n=1 Tax=Trichomalopsis sarcophagae TaxID=543379 RepID=A0A232EX01_9HYME|nr:hypothetical protein TSAR_000160 [Trichomalopsis sarcophagae]